MISDICGAIAGFKIIYFQYKMTKRVVEPHTLGYARDGQLTLSAYQISGGSGIGWRDFHVALMSNLQISDEIFDTPRNGYSRNDKTLKEIICQI